MDDVLINAGGAIKAMGQGKVAGYLVRFGSEDAPDLSGEYFTKATDFDIQPGQPTAVYYQHGLDPVLKTRKIGSGTLTTDGSGVWLDAQLNMADQYEKMIYGMVEKGKGGLSSGTASHLVQKRKGAKATEITRWPLGLDASITPTPAEHRNYGGVRPLKSYIVAPLVAHGAITGGTRTGMDEEQLQQIADLTATVKSQGAQLDKLIAFIEAEPALKSAGYVTDGMVKGGGKTNAVKTLGNFLIAVKRGDVKTLSEVYGSVKMVDGDAIKLDEISGAGGGYTVPVQFVTQIKQMAVEQEVMFPRATIQPMSAREIDIPVLDYSGAYAAGATTMLAGFGMTWIGERQTITTAQPSFRQLKLVANKMARSVPVSNELLRDNAIGLEAVLTRIFGDAVAFTRDYAAFNGDGVAKPLGIIGAPATIITGTALSSPPTVAQLSKMYGRMLSSSKSTAIWVINPLLTADLMAVNATGNFLTFLPSLNGEVVMRLFGKPVYETEKVPATFAAGGLLLIDPKAYIFGDRQQMEIAYSDQVLFDTDESKWRCVARLDGQPALNAPIKIGSSAGQTLSTFIQSL